MIDTLESYRLADLIALKMLRLGYHHHVKISIIMSASL